MDPGQDWWRTQNYTTAVSLPPSRNTVRVVDCWQVNSRVRVSTGSRSQTRRVWQCAAARPCRNMPTQMYLGRDHKPVTPPHGRSTILSHKYERTFGCRRPRPPSRLSIFYIAKTPWSRAIDVKMTQIKWSAVCLYCIAWHRLVTWLQPPFIHSWWIDHGH